MKIEREKSSQSIIKKHLQFKISSEETLSKQQKSSQDVKLANRKSLDISSLEQKNLQQTEKLIRSKSAPVVILDELEELLWE